MNFSFESRVSFASGRHRGIHSKLHNAAGPEQASARWRSIWAPRAEAEPHIHPPRLVFSRVLGARRPSPRHIPLSSGLAGAHFRLCFRPILASTKTSKAILLSTKPAATTRGGFTGGAKFFCHWRKKRRIFFFGDMERRIFFFFELERRIGWLSLFPPSGTPVSFPFSQGPRPKA